MVREDSSPLNLTMAAEDYMKILNRSSFCRGKQTFGKANRRFDPTKSKSDLSETFIVTGFYQNAWRKGIMI